MRRKSLLLLPCLAMAGCAVAGPGPQSQMAAYVGADTQTVVQKLGVPDKHISVNGDVQYLTYLFVTNYWIPCEITFVLKNDRVIGFTPQGYCD